MNFIKHTWQKGETITPQKLNRIEDELEYLHNNSSEIATDADCDALFVNFLQDDDED